MSKLEYLKKLQVDISAGFEEIKKYANDELVIDDHDLDGESLRTPRLHTRWLALMGEESLKLKQLQAMSKKFYLERWRYYLGTQTDKYYAEYGQVHVKVLKTDVSTYLDADDYIIAMKEVVDIQDQIVSFIERAVKEISSRTFHIKSAIDWRRFQSGA